MQVIVVFYGVLFRTTMTAAMVEVDRTRAFIDRIPSHVITREVMKRFGFLH